MAGGESARRRTLIGALPAIHLADLLASLTGAVAAVPDGMASSVIVGVSPIHGLYASIVGPIVGGLTARTRLLVVTTTGASALAAAEVVRRRPADEQVGALILITLLAGAFQVLAAAAGLARLTNFVSHSVMKGFFTGVAVLIILGQLGTLFGYDASGSNAVFKTADLARHAGSFDATTTAVGLTTIVLLLLFEKGGLGAVGPLIALALPSLVVAGAGLGSVAVVSDIGSIPSNLPLPALPDASLLSLPVVTGALAVGAIVFVQTAGVSQGLSAGDATGQTRDLAASGFANVGSALFQGQPVGASLSASALNRQSGARTRFAAVLGGVWVLLIILLLSGVVARVAMSSLAALLIVSAWGAVDRGEAAAIWGVGWDSRLTIVFTFVATLLLPIQLAVGLGVLVSAALNLRSTSADVHLVQLMQLPSGELEERALAPTLTSGTITVVQVYGSLFYAGARTLARRLPAVGESERCVVILRLRGKTRLGATAIDVLASYGRQLRARGGRLYMAGVNPELVDRLRHESKLALAGVQIYPALNVIGRSVGQSTDDARAWLFRHSG